MCLSTFNGGSVKEAITTAGAHTALLHMAAGR